jgi:predicted lipoprotein with Yx(FWY)xxD motif
MAAARVVGPTAHYDVGSQKMRTSPVIKATVFAGLAALLVAGCSSSKKSSSATPTAAASTAAAAAPASAAAGSGAAAPAGAATVSAQTGALGNYLTDGSGKSLYLYTPDTSTTSTCYGQCIAFWPALETTGAPKAGTGADASMLGTSKRTDGTTQVTYNGHPLYYYKGDKAAGDTSGQGKAGTWYLVTPAGTQIGGGSGASSAAAPSAAASS